MLALAFLGRSGVLPIKKAVPAQRTLLVISVTGRLLLPELVEGEHREDVAGRDLYLQRAVVRRVVGRNGDRHGVATDVHGEPSAIGVKRVVVTLLEMPAVFGDAADPETAVVGADECEGRPFGGYGDILSVEFFDIGTPLHFLPVAVRLRA